MLFSPMLAIGEVDFSKTIVGKWILRSVLFPLLEACSLGNQIGVYEFTDPKIHARSIVLSFEISH